MTSSVSAAAPALPPPKRSAALRHAKTNAQVAKYQSPRPSIFGQLLAIHHAVAGASDSEK
jgi:hypothetical protein